jgi:succinyl-CoA synthetase beta subunit
MKLFEYQAQKLLEDCKIPVPGGKLATSAGEAFGIVDAMKTRAVVKAQVLTGGRGKAGGIKLVASPEEARSAAEKILHMTIKDNPVHSVFITPAVDIVKEMYVSIVLNRSDKRID